MTRRFSSMKMLFWCNREHDVIEVIIRDPQERALLSKEVPEPEGTVDVVEGQPCFHIITKHCTCMEAEKSVLRLIEDLNILYISPGMAEKGWEYHRIVIFSHEDFEELMRRFEKAGFSVEILRKASLDGFVASSLTLNADALFSGLTQKQIDAILTAHKFGYFNMPRKADVQAIAAKKNVPRMTFSDNLKKAENKLVTALIPYIQLFSLASKERRENLKIKRHRTRDREYKRLECQLRQ